MLGFKILITSDQVIKIHPLVYPPFNADFDGDQMAVYIPVTEGAKQEIIEKISVSKNLNSPSNENLTTTPSQDIILGGVTSIGIQSGNLCPCKCSHINSSTLGPIYYKVHPTI